MIFLAKTGLDGPRKRKKNYRLKFCSNLTRARKFKKKNSKKIEKIKKLNSGIISIQNGLREAKIEEKKNLDPNSVPTRAGLPFPKKIAKKFKKLKHVIPTLCL